MTRIAIFCDGTWDRLSAAGGKAGRTTNVSRLYHAVKERPGQVAWHDNGVGADRNGLSRFIAGATGLGLGANVREAYREVCRQFRDPQKDSIYIFGFSRGAYTARSLAGMIRNCGVITDPSGPRVRKAYRFYRGKHHPGCPTSDRFRTDMGAKTPDIRFLGVFDTVGSLGIPIGRLGRLGMRWNDFHDVQLSSSVLHACHAVAIDEARKPFRPTLWAAPDREAGKPLEQAWFPGYHRDVGGGAAADAVSNVAMHWIGDQARAAGLDVPPPSSDPDDQRHDPHPDDPHPDDPDPDPDTYHRGDPTGPLHDSMKWHYRILGDGTRHMGDPRYQPQGVSAATEARRATGAYARDGVDRLLRDEWIEKGPGPRPAKRCRDFPGP